MNRVHNNVRVISIRCVTEALCSFSGEPREPILATLPFSVLLFSVSSSAFFFFFSRKGRATACKTTYPRSIGRTSSFYRGPVNFAIGPTAINCAANAHDDSISY